VGAALSFADGHLIPFASGVYLAGMVAAFMLGNLRDAVHARVGLLVVVGSAAIIVYNLPDHSAGVFVFIPLLFAIGTASVTMVGVNIGAGLHARAWSIAWSAALISVAVSGTIGFIAWLFPQAWIHLFSREAEVVAVGVRYLERVAPFYAFTGLGMALYFASQGAGRMAWPFSAGVARLGTVIVAGAWWVGIAHGSLTGLFWIVAASQVLFGAINVFGMATGRSWSFPTQTALRFAHEMDRHA